MREKRENKLAPKNAWLDQLLKNKKSNNEYKKLKIPKKSISTSHLPKHYKHDKTKQFNQTLQQKIDLKLSPDEAVALLSASSPRNFFSRSKNTDLNSRSLWPPPCTQSGSTAAGHFWCRPTPWQMSMMSSSVPWITRVGDRIFLTLSTLGKGSQQMVVVMLGKATLRPDMRPEWMTTPAARSFAARWMVGTVPML